MDAAADLGRTVTFCAKHDLGGMEGLIGVPGTVGGALRMNAGAYGMQIGSYVREIQLYRAADRRIVFLRGSDINFEYRHTSFAPDDIMLAVKLELPSKPYREILQGIRICNEKRRSSQPLNQKSAGCIFKNPPGASAGRMIDELGLKGLQVGDACVSEPPRQFFPERRARHRRRHAAADRSGARPRARRFWSRARNRSDLVAGPLNMPPVDGHYSGHATTLNDTACRLYMERRRSIKDQASEEMNAEPDTYPSEALADEEPRYLRRQKPLEIRRRKFARGSWPTYRNWLLAGAG